MIIQLLDKQYPSTTRNYHWR